MQTMRTCLKPVVGIPSLFNISTIAAPWGDPSYWDYEAGVWRVVDDTPRHLFVSASGDAGSWDESNDTVTADVVEWKGDYYIPDATLRKIGKVAAFNDLFTPGGYDLVYDVNQSAGYVGHAATDGFLFFMWLSGTTVRIVYTTDGVNFTYDYFDNGVTLYGEIYTIGDKVWITSIWGRTLSFTIAEGLRRESPLHLPFDYYGHYGSLAYDEVEGVSHLLSELPKLPPESDELIYDRCSNGAYVRTPTNLAALVAQAGWYIYSISFHRLRNNLNTFASWSADKSVFLFAAEVSFRDPVGVKTSYSRRFLFLSKDGGDTWSAEDVTSRIPHTRCFAMNPAGTKAFYTVPGAAVYIDIL